MMSHVTMVLIMTLSGRFVRLISVEHGSLESNPRGLVRVTVVGVWKMRV